MVKTGTHTEQILYFTGITTDIFPPLLVFLAAVPLQGVITCN